MIYPNISVEEWLMRYPDLEVLKEECPGCNKLRIVDIPFVTQDWIGLSSKKCDCGCDSIVTKIGRNERTIQRAYNLYEALRK